MFACPTERSFTRRARPGGMPTIQLEKLTPPGNDTQRALSEMF